jgi:DNA-directed RNA polymerase subunit M/transcription elongation factor TFIIS
MNRVDWSQQPTVFIVAACCPHCGAVEHDRSRTDDNGDGSVTRFCKCRICGGRFKLVVETSPDPGELAVWPS